MMIRLKALLVIAVAVAWLPLPAFAQSALPWVFHSGATATGDGSVMPADYFSTVAVQVEGTFVGTVVFEKKTRDATGYVLVQCVNTTDHSQSTEATEPGYWECPGGANGFKARVSAYTSGTIRVTGTGTTAVSGGRGIGSGGAWTADVTTANSLGNARCIGDGGAELCFYADGTLGPLARPNPDANTRFYVWTNFTGCIPWDVEGNACMLTYDPDAASKNAMYQFGSAYYPEKVMRVALSPRGATAIAEESVITNQPASWWATLTDVDTDSVDFALSVTADMSHVTTATVRLYGVSKNAAPSGNIELDCAIQSYRPGTDIFAAHSTTGERAVLLTPATQYRQVAATSSAITINGTVATGATLYGSCQIDATATTSTQMTDFRLWGFADVRFTVNSLSN